MMNDRVIFFLIYYPVFLLSLSLHESAHAWTASKFGDNTAKNLGRISLNPIKHMDFIGTFLLPVIFFFMPGLSFPIGGWGKPVPVNPYNLPNPRKNGLWISLAGPASNVFLALLCAFALRMPLFQNSWLVAVFTVGVFLNLSLAIFNLVPLHPLDGGKILEGILPESMLRLFSKFASYGFIILFAVYYIVGFGFISAPVRFLAKILIP